MVDSHLKKKLYTTGWVISQAIIHSITERCIIINQKNFFIHTIAKIAA